MLPPDSAACAYLTRPGETSPMPATGDAYRQSVFADRATGGAVREDACMDDPARFTRAWQVSAVGVTTPHGAGSTAIG